MVALDPIPGPGEPSPKKVMVRIDKFIPSDLRLLDDSCLIRYLQSIPLPIGATQVDVYEIEPGAKTQWIVVKHFDGNISVLKIFIRDGEALLENQFQDLPGEVKRKIVQRFPKLRSAFQCTLAA